MIHNLCINLMCIIGIPTKYKLVENFKYYNLLRVSAALVNIFRDVIQRIKDDT